MNNSKSPVADLSLFQQVEQELRRDRRLKWLKRYALPWGSALLALVVVTTVGYVLWDSFEHERLATDTSRLASIVENLTDPTQTDDPQIVQQLNTFTAEGQTSITTLAKLVQAGQLPMGSGERSRLLWDLVDSPTVSQDYRQLALILAVSNDLDLPSSDPDMLQGRLEPLTASDNPWRFAALELLALLLAERQQNYTAARESLNQLINDQHTPHRIQDRAEDLLAHYTYGVNTPVASSDAALDVSEPPPAIIEESLALPDDDLTPN